MNPRNPLGHGIPNRAIQIHLHLLFRPLWADKIDQSHSVVQEDPSGGIITGVTHDLAAWDALGEGAHKGEDGRADPFGVDVDSLQSYREPSEFGRLVEVGLHIKNRNHARIESFQRSFFRRLLLQSQALQG